MQIINCYHVSKIIGSSRLRSVIFVLFVRLDYDLAIIYGRLWNLLITGVIPYDKRGGDVDSFETNVFKEIEDRICTYIYLGSFGDSVFFTYVSVRSETVKNKTIHILLTII